MMRQANTLWAAMCAVGILGVLAVVSCNDLPSGPASAQASGVRGLTLSCWTRDAYASPEAQTAIDRIASVGSTHLMLLTTAYQQTRHSDAVRPDSALTPTVASLYSAALYARSKNLELALTSHVDVRDGSWRATIDPLDPSAWFDSYRAFLLPLAEFADSIGAVQFVVGTELAGTLRHEDEWRRTIAEVRSRFSGVLVYAASWDEAMIVPFWDAVDRPGIDAYFPITERRDAGRIEILAGWQIWMNRLEQLHRRTAKSIIFTELGYRSVDGAGMAPYDFRVSGRPDPTEQADLYWGALEAVSHAAWIDGVYWWTVRPGGPTDGLDTEYTPLGKPAEGELRLSWSVP